MAFIMSDHVVRTTDHPAFQGNRRLPDRLIFGCSYYDEYMAYERVDKDMSMMKSVGITTMRIPKSTSGTLES